MRKTEKLRKRPDATVSGYRRIRVEVRRTCGEFDGGGGGIPAGIIMGCCIKISDVY